MDNVQTLRPRNSSSPDPRAQWGLRALGALFIIALVALSLVDLWVDLLWFDELGQREVMVTRIQWSFAMGAVSGLVAFAVLLGNALVALRISRNDLYVPFLAPSRDPEAPEQPTVPHFVLKPVLIGAAALLAILAGLVMAGRWETVLRWRGRTDFGVDDPVFGHDVSFFVFSIPLMELAVAFLQGIIVLTALVVVGAYVATGVIRYTPVQRIARSAVAHLAAIGSAFFVIQALGYRIQAWNVVHSRQGIATGAGYADLQARLPGFYVMIAASVVVAVLLLWFARRSRWKPAGYAVLGWLALATISGGIAPAAVQNVLVEPNELRREQDLLRNNINMTRIAYGLDDVRSARFPGDASLTEEQIEPNRTTLDNIRLWSPEVLKRSLVQLQEFRPYYEFQDVDVDRYRIDGQYRQVMIAAREMRPERLQGQATWVNQRLQYTHGYGVAAAWPNETTNRGRPQFLLQDIPPRSNVEGLEVTRPEIYFGERPDHWVIVNSEEQEFDFPEGDTNRMTRYEGDGGIQISNAARRAAFALTFSDPRIMLTGAITNESRFMFRRNIQERVREIAPFLDLDDDPYVVVHDGRLVYIQDAYTTSDRFPYAQHINISGNAMRPEPVNYMRNSVKAVIDAYDGSVTLYVMDDDDPVLAAWRNIFPSLFTPAEEMPEGLVEHLRYPEKIFEVQTAMWNEYHMGEVQTFYNKEDLWEVPTVDGNALAPFYILARLPGEKEEEMLLVRPMVPAGKRNMIAYMGARMDPGRYGELITYQLPKQTLTQGPTQVSALIKQDPVISQQLSLWDRREGSRPVMGNLLVLPIENSLLYVQPIYLESAEAELPEFERVVVVLGDTVAWGETFDEALEAVFERRANGGRPAATPDDDDAAAPDDDAAGDPGADAPGDERGADVPAGGGDMSREELRAVLAQVSQHYDRAIECQRAGDWECYGRETRAMQELLEQAG